MSSLIGIHTDTSLWLHNKLRNDDNPWSSGSMASQFTIHILGDIYERFIQLESKDKIKILLAMLEIPLRNMENLRDSISRIVALAEEDLDEWVRVAANIVRDYPQQFELDQRLGKVTTHFQQTAHEIISEIERLQEPANTNLIPGECLFLNPTSLSKIMSPPPPPAKHFTLRRKPKSAELRAKITQKATDAANQRRSMHPSGTTSKANLKRTTSLPSGKLPPVQHSKTGISKALPKKTKILEFADQPLGVREQKKRRKAQAMEAASDDVGKQKKKSSDSTKQSTQKEPEEKEKEIEKKTEENIEQEAESDVSQSQEEPSTPIDDDNDLSATPSLFHPAPLTPTEEKVGVTEEEQPQTSKPTPSYALLPGSSKKAKPTNLPVQSPPVIPKDAFEDLPESNSNVNKTTSRKRRTSSALNQQHPEPMSQAINEIPSQQSQQQPSVVPQLSHKISNMINVNPNASLSTQNFQRELQMHAQQEHEQRVKHEHHKQQQQQQQQQQPQPQPQQIQQQQHQQQQQHLFNQQLLHQHQQQLRQAQQQQQQQQQPFLGDSMKIPPSAMPLQAGGLQMPAQTLPGMAMQQPAPQLGVNPQKKGLSLTRDQMLAAQEMFRSANRVTRAEKALILGFMAGARENPFPQQGSVITIKLSEDLIPQGDQHTFVEMLFEMNYDTGHWRRLKRTRVMQQGANS